MPSDPPGTSSDDLVSNARRLRDLLPLLSLENAHERAAASEKLLELEFGDDARGVPWALALCASGCVTPLLRSIQRVKRDVETLAPIEGDVECVAGDAALLVLSELANVAAGLLESEGYQLEACESTGKALFVDVQSGMASEVAPGLRCSKGMDREDASALRLLIETLTLVTPIGVDARTGKLAWSVEIIDHVPMRDDGARPEVSVIDMAVEGGSVGELTRTLVIGPWRGSDGDVDAEKDPNEPLGVALDSWRDATYVTGALSGAGTVLRRVLVCGCAGGAVPTFLTRYCPEASVVVDVVESDEVLVELSETHFGLACARMRADENGSSGRCHSDVRVWCEDFVQWGRRSAAAAIRYDAILGRFPSDAPVKDIWDIICALLADDGVAALSSCEGDAAEAMTTKDESRVRLLRDPENMTFEDVGDRPEKRARASVASDVRAQDVVCYFASSPGDDVFDPATWMECATKKLGEAVERFPYRVAGCDIHGCVTVLDYAERDENNEANGIGRIDASNAAWDAFDDGPMAHSNAENVFDAEYWNAILSAHGCSISNGSDSHFDEVDTSATVRHIDTLHDEGYVWGDVIIPSEQTTALRRGIEALVDAKWPPACVFVSDVAWQVIDALFAHAEALLGGECVLEPSVAAFKLEKDASGKRYIGNNFGVPHRDYSRDDAVDEDGRAQVLSLWLPLNRVTETSGCMFVVSKKDDADGGMSDAAKTAPEVPRGAARALAPVDPGSLLAWAGNIIHWGSACALDSPDAPRMSVAFVFRRRGDAERRADARCPPLTRADARSASLERRLAVIRHALGVFEHWYGDAADVRAKLSA